MSTIVYGDYGGTPSLGTGIFRKIRNPADGSIILARTNGGISERDPGRYTTADSVAVDLDAYDIVWDEGDGNYYGQLFQPRPTVTVNITEGSPLPIIGDANADLLGRTFLIKRGDTLPYLRRQLVDTNGSAISIDALDTVMFTMRASTDVAMAGSAKVHASAEIIDPGQGIVEYRWIAADTNTTTWTETGLLGQHVDTPYAGEFELTRNSDGKIETFPQDGYIAISIPPDLDPGVNP